MHILITRLDIKHLTAGPDVALFVDVAVEDVVGEGDEEVAADVEFAGVVEERGQVTLDDCGGGGAFRRRRRGVLFGWGLSLLELGL